MDAMSPGPISASVPSSCTTFIRPEMQYSRWGASHLSVPASGLMCSDQRQPGSNVPKRTGWPPTLKTPPSPMPAKDRFSSGELVFLTSTPATARLLSWVGARILSHGTGLSGSDVALSNLGPGPCMKMSRDRNGRGRHRPEVLSNASEPRLIAAQRSHSLPRVLVRREHLGGGSRPRRVGLRCGGAQERRGLADCFRGGRLR